MKYIKLFEDLSHRQKVLNYKKNKPIEVPFVKEVDEKTFRVECKERGWYIDFYFDWEGRLAAVDNPWDIKIPEWIGHKIGNATIILWSFRLQDTTGNCVDSYKILDREAEKYNL